MHILKAPDDVLEPRPLVITCHGYAQRPATMLRFTQLWVKNCIIVSMQGNYPCRYSGGRAKKAFSWIDIYNPQASHQLHIDNIANVIDELVAKGLVDANRIILVGFSQSVALNYRFALQKIRKLAGLVAIMGGLPSDINRLDVKFDSPTLVVGATEDSYYSINKTCSFIKTLNKFNIPITELWYKGKHELPISLDIQMESWFKRVI